MSVSWLLIISPDIIPSGWLGSKHQLTSGHYLGYSSFKTKMAILCFCFCFESCTWSSRSLSTSFTVSTTHNPESVSLPPLSLPFSPLSSLPPSFLLPLSFPPSLLLCPPPSLRIFLPPFLSPSFALPSLPPFSRPLSPSLLSSPLSLSLCFPISLPLSPFSLSVTEVCGSDPGFVRADYRSVSNEIGLSGLQA